MNDERKLKREKIIVFVLTFFVYASFHLSRKPPSVVKGVLHPQSPGGKSTFNPDTNPGWSPFSQDLDPVGNNFTLQRERF